ncbi:MAG: glycosyltransferase [Calditrichia bacterium]
MNVLHLSTAKTWRGGEQQLAYLLVELRKMDVQQQVVCVMNSPMFHFCKAEGFDAVATSKKSSLDLRYSWSIASAARKFSPEIVHSHDSHAHSFALYSKLFRRFQINLIASRRVDFPVGQSISAKWKYRNPEVKKILCVSDAIRDIMLRSVDSERLATVYSGIDAERFRFSADGRLRKLANLSQNIKLIGNVAALAPHKDYPTFLNTAKQVLSERNDVHFFLIGEGGLRSELEGLCRELQIEKHVTFCGFRDDIEYLLPELDVFLISSETEGLGTSILDAFAAGVAVVATAAGGIPELVLPEKTGLLCPVKDEACLSKAVHRMLDEVNLAKRLTTGAKQHVQKFYKGETAKRTLEIYRNILER